MLQTVIKLKAVGVDFHIIHLILKNAVFLKFNVKMREKEYILRIYSKNIFSHEIISHESEVL